LRKFKGFSRIKYNFYYPLHYHEEFELNFIKNAKGVKRVIGDPMEDIEDLELVLFGPNLQHVWHTHLWTREKEKMSPKKIRDSYASEVSV
jgi:hypothetical protein